MRRIHDLFQAPFMHDPLTLTECCQNWHADLSVDSRQRLVGNVALAGPHSRNGYTYSEEALTRSVPLYEQKPVFLDHSSRPGRPTERSTRDLVGTVIRPRFENGKVRGDIQVLDTESGRLFLQLVEADAPGVGMSHVVLARRSHDGTTIAAIEDVISVDVVVNPATTTTFRESCAHPSSDAAAFLEPLAALTLERDKLRDDLRIAQQQLALLHRQNLIGRLIEESSLPASAVTPVFRRQLLEAAHLDVCRELIADREQLCTLPNRQWTVPRSSERPSTSAAILEEEFIRGIRRS